MFPYTSSQPKGLLDKLSLRTYYISYNRIFQIIYKTLRKVASVIKTFIKRGFARSIAILLSVLFLGGCAGSKNEDRTVILTLWHYYSGGQLVSFDRLIQEFNETKGAEAGVYIEAVSHGSANALAEKVIESASGVPGVDQLPDIFFAYGDSAYVAKTLGVTADLDEYFTETELSAFVGAFVEEGRFPADFGLTILPVAKANEILYVDDNEWKRLKEAVETDPVLSAKYPVFTDETLSTWEGLAMAAEAYFELTGQAFFGVDNFANFLYIAMYQKGVSFASYGPDGIVFDLDKEVMREVWDYYFYPFMAGYFNASSRYRSDDVKTGELIAYVGSKASSRYFPKTVTLIDGSEREANLLALSMPAFQDGIKASYSQGAGMVMTKTDPDREKAVAEFLKWFTETDRNIEFSINASYLPVKNEAYSAEVMEAMLGMLDVDDSYASRYDMRALTVAVSQMSGQDSYTPAVFDKSLEVRTLIEDAVNFLKEARESLAPDNNPERLEDLCREGFEELYQELVKLCR